MTHDPKLVQDLIDVAIYSRNQFVTGSPNYKLIDKAIEALRNHLMGLDK